MKLFNTTIEAILVRYYLMMTVVIASFMFGVPYLSILALPVFLSALLGVRFTSRTRHKETQLQQHDRNYAEKAA